MLAAVNVQYWVDSFQKRRGCIVNGSGRLSDYVWLSRAGVAARFVSALNGTCSGDRDWVQISIATHNTFAAGSTPSGAVFNSIWVV